MFPGLRKSHNKINLKYSMNIPNEDVGNEEKRSGKLNVNHL